MADKKITALTELSATDKRGEDFLHIIDYGGGSSPVNKKISLTNLFNNINLDSHIYGASKTFEVGFGATTNAHLTVTTGSANNADGTVTINQDGVDFVDFLVKTGESDQALSIDSGADTVTINGDGKGLDFQVNGENVDKMIFCDASADVVGIGVAAPATAYTLDVAATGTLGIKSAGSVHVTGEITATTDITLGGLQKYTETPATIVGGATGAKTAIPVNTSISFLTANSATNADYFTLAAGTSGQVKYLLCTGGTGTVDAIISGLGTAIHGGTADSTTGGTANTVLHLGYQEGVMLMFLNSGWAIVGGGIQANVAAT